MPIKPYYQHAGVTIYHGDCQEILPSIPPPIDVAVVSDPPYGIGYVQGAWDGPNASRFQGVAVVGDDEPFDPSHLLAFERVLLWGSNHFADKLPVRDGRWLVWDKRCQVVPQRNQSDCEIAWARGTNGKADRMFYHVWDGFLKDSEKGVKRVHPTQKPIPLMRWCIEFFPGAKTIIDPYCGSGATLIAAKELGLVAVGIDCEEQYCEAAAKRLSQDVLDFGIAA